MQLFFMEVLFFPAVWLWGAHSCLLHNRYPLCNINAMCWLVLLHVSLLREMWWGHDTRWQGSEFTLQMFHLCCYSPVGCSFHAVGSNSLLWLPLCNTGIKSTCIFAPLTAAILWLLLQIINDYYSLRSLICSTWWGRIRWRWIEQWRETGWIG